jgi:hypothetical protein
MIIGNPVQEAKEILEFSKMMRRSEEMNLGKFKPKIIQIIPAPNGVYGLSNEGSLYFSDATTEWKLRVIGI